MRRRRHTAADDAAPPTSPSTGIINQETQAVGKNRLKGCPEDERTRNERGPSEVVDVVVVVVVIRGSPGRRRVPFDRARDLPLRDFLA